MKASMAMRPLASVGAASPMSLIASLEALDRVESSVDTADTISARLSTSMVVSPRVRRSTSSMASSGCLTVPA